MDKAATILAQLLARSGYDQLSARERYILAAGATFVVCFLLYLLALAPYLEARQQLVRSLAVQQQELGEVQRLQAEYRQVKSQAGSIREQLNSRQADFTLFTFLDQQAQQANIKQQLVYMKPSVVEGDTGLDESIVELKVQNIDLERLVTLLRLVESPANLVSIRRLSIQTSSGEGEGLDAILQVVTFVEGR